MHLFRKTTPFVFLTLLFSLSSGCKVDLGGKWNGKKKDGPVDPVPVKIASVSLSTISSYFRFHSLLTPEKEVEIYSRASGIVTSRNAEEGDHVAAGELLLRLEDNEQKLTLARAETNFTHNNEELTKAEELFSRGMLPDEEIRRIRLAASEASNALEQARLSMTYTSVRSPFEGVITKRMFDVGDRIDPSRPLYTLVDMSRLYADGWVNESELTHIHLGDKAIVRSQFDSTQVMFGKVLRISSVVDPVYGKIKITFVIDGKSTSLKPGQFVEILITLETHNEALTLPKRALVYEAGEPVVFSMVDSLVFRTPVKVGISEGSQIEILSGLSLADKVVVDGQSTLRDSTKVRPIMPGR